MSYKVDKTYFSSQFGAYQIYNTIVYPILISDSLPASTTFVYQLTINFTRDNAKGRAFIQRHDASIKAPMDKGRAISHLSPTYEIYQFAGAELARTNVHYENSGQQLVLDLELVNNTGSPISLTTQTVDFVVDLYDGPVA